MMSEPPIEWVWGNYQIIVCFLVVLGLGAILSFWVCCFCDRMDWYWFNKREEDRWAEEEGVNCG